MFCYFADENAGISAARIAPTSLAPKTLKDKNYANKTSLSKQPSTKTVASQQLSDTSVKQEITIQNQPQDIITRDDLAQDCGDFTKSKTSQSSTEKSNIKNLERNLSPDNERTKDVVDIR